VDFPYAPEAESHPRLYSHADEDERFLLDYFVGTMVRDHEAYGGRFSDLTGTTLTVTGKQHKTRTVEITQRLAEGMDAAVGMALYKNRLH
jgi:integrase